MSFKYLESAALIRVTRSALRPEFLLTTAVAILGAVVLFGVLGLGGDDSFSSLLGDFLAVSSSALWLMLGLVALAHQLNRSIEGGETLPGTTESYIFAWQRLKAIILLPAWGVGLLLLVLLVEIIVLSLANIPGLGTVWLALIAVPLLLFNTLVGVFLMLSVFNVAAYVAVSESPVAAMRKELWLLMKSKFKVLVVYNLGGVLLTLLIATLVLSPLWLGAQATLALLGYAASEPWKYLVEAIGFWGSIAHFIGLIMGGLLLAAIGAVPIIVITHITLLVHLELAQEEPNDTHADLESEPDVAAAAEGSEKGES